MGLDRPDILSGLTENQRAAVERTEGPLLVLAGPGSGKTRVITRRIAHLVDCGIPAWQILALTFTNKAAAEMRQRVAAMLGEGPASRGLTVTTFHALGARLLRKYSAVAELPGISPTFAIYDSADQQALMKRVIAEVGLSTANFPVRAALERVSRAKNELQDAAVFSATASDFQSRQYAKIFLSYEKALRKAGAVDFDDLLVLTAKLLRRSFEVREDCLRRWKYLLIDEYQDTNRAQFVIAALLAGSDPGAPDAEDATPAAGAPASRGGVPANICVVGDPDQSIYGWRGADISNILDFERQFPGASVIALGENFRSTGPILAAADALIRHNQRRKHKDLIAHRGEGRRVDLVACREEHHEAALVLEWIRALRAESEEASGTEAGPPAPPLAYKDFAVFYRTNALSRVLEDTLRNAGVPYVIARGTAFYQREEIKHALAYLRLLANPADEISLERVVNVPARGIGDKSFAGVQAEAARLALPTLEAMRRIARAPVPEVSSRAAAAMGRFVEMLDGWAGAGMLTSAESEPTGPGGLSGLVSRVLRESGLEAMYAVARSAGGAAAAGDSEADRADNLAELISSAAEFEQEYDPSADPAASPAIATFGGAVTEGISLPPLLPMLRAYLERITLVADADSVDPAQGAVTLMTLHAAKGLEFRAAAMIGLEEGGLPHIRAQIDPSELEEERRLCFVGMTRAMDHLLMTTARFRTVRGISERMIASRFLDELPPQHVRRQDLADETVWDPRNDDESGSDIGRLRPIGVGRSGGAPRTAVTPSSGRSVAGFRVGDTVRHPQFGVGQVLSLSLGQNARVQVKFRDVGVKTLVIEYARLVRMNT